MNESGDKKMKKKTFLILYGIVYSVVYLLVWAYIYLTYGFTSESAVAFSIFMYLLGATVVLTICFIFSPKNSKKYNWTNCEEEKAKP